MEKSLQDTCRDAKLEQHITAQEIADQSGVPLSSVNNVFASTSKAPGVYAAGPHMQGAGGVYGPLLWHCRGCFGARPNQAAPASP